MRERISLHSKPHFVHGIDMILLVATLFAADRPGLRPTAPCRTRDPDRTALVYSLGNMKRVVPPTCTVLIHRQEDAV